MSCQREHSITRLDVYCCARGCLFAADSREKAAVCDVRYNFHYFMQWSGNKRAVYCQSEHERIPPYPKHTHTESHFLIYGNSLYGHVSWIHTKGDTPDMPSRQPTEHPRASPPRSTGPECTPLYPSCVHLPESSVSRANATGALQDCKKLVEVALVGSKIRLASWLGCELLY